MDWQIESAKLIMQVSADGVYRYREALLQVPRQNGKNFLVMWMIIHRLLMHKTPQLVLGTAHSLAMAKELLEAVYRTMRSHPWLSAQIAAYKQANGQEALILTNGSRYVIKAANADAGRGLSVDLLVFDEIRSQDSFDAWDALMPTMMARPSPQLLAMSNAGNPDSSVMRSFRSRALSASGQAILVEYSAPPGCDISDRQAWAAANPSLGRTLSVAALEAASASPPQTFRREHLNQEVTEGDSAIDLHAWAECTDAEGQVPGSERARVAACVDVGMDGCHVTLAIACRLGDGRTWAELAGSWEAVPDAMHALPGIFDKIQPAALAWFPAGPAQAIASVLRSRPGVTELRGGDVTEACALLASLTAARKVVHSDDALLSRHVSGAVRMQSGDAWRFARRGRGNIDACYAAAGAVHALLTMPEPRRARIRLLG